MGYDPPRPLLTSLIEMKLDWSMMFECKRNTQESSDVPYYAQILFYVGLDRFVVRDVFLSVFGGSIVTIKIGMEHTFSSRRFDLFGPSSVVVHTNLLWDGLV